MDMHTRTHTHWPRLVCLLRACARLRIVHAWLKQGWQEHACMCMCVRVCMCVCAVLITSGYKSCYWLTCSSLAAPMLGSSHLYRSVTHTHTHTHTHIALQHLASTCTKPHSAQQNHTYFMRVNNTADMWRTAVCMCVCDLMCFTGCVRPAAIAKPVISA